MGESLFSSFFFGWILPSDVYLGATGEGCGVFGVSVVGTCSP